MVNERTSDCYWHGTISSHSARLTWISLSGANSIEPADLTKTESAPDQFTCATCGQPATGQDWLTLLNGPNCWLWSNDAPLCPACQLINEDFIQSHHSN